MIYSKRYPNMDAKISMLDGDETPEMTTREKFNRLSKDTLSFYQEK